MDDQAEPVRSAHPDHGGLDALIESARDAERRADWSASAELYGRCLERYPDDPQHLWWIGARARAFLELGRLDEAEDGYRRLAEGSPGEPWGDEGLGYVADRRGQWRKSADFMSACLARFPAYDNRRWWLQTRGYALLNLRLYDDARTDFTALRADFPNDRDGHVGLAWAAEHAWDWLAAIENWDRSIAMAESDETRAQAIARKAECLVQIGRIPDARMLLSSIADRLEGLEGLARLVATQELPEAAAQAWKACVARFPDQAAGYVGWARWLFEREQYGRAETLLFGARTRFPDSAQIALLWARCATATKNWAEASGRWKMVLTASPHEPDVRIGYIRHLTSLGDHAAAERYLASLADPIARADCRIEYCLAQEDYGSAAEEAGHLAGLQQQVPAHQFRLVTILMRHGAPEALREACGILEALRRKSPRSVWIAVRLCEAYISSGADRLAEEILDDIPDSARGAEIEILRAWRAHSDGDDAAAKRRWEAILARRYVPAIHSRIADLERVDGNDIDGRTGEILLFSVMRNADPRLDWFLGYYRKLGVDKFVIIDNKSSDNTLKRLLREHDVILYRTADSYGLTGAGMRWVNELIDRHGRNGWCLDADPDEAFVFPDCERQSLRQLVDYLNSKKYEAVSAVMLDMYPRSIGGVAGSNIAQIQAAYRFFDRRIYSYPHPICPYVEQYGGARRRLFRGYQLMNKAPLFNGAAGIKYLLGEHRITPARIADVTGVLLHYHLVAAIQAEYRAVFNDTDIWREVPGNSMERGRVEASLPRLSGSSLLGEDGVEYQSSEQLTALSLMRAGEFLTVDAPLQAERDSS